jgi:hypothetical protein
LSRALRLTPGHFAVARLAPDAPLPAWGVGPDLVAALRTPDELTIVCRADLVPVGTVAAGPYRAIRVVGTIDLGETGVLAGLAVPLAKAGVPLFALSTFDTDYVLVPESVVGDAIEALVGAGYTIEG